MDEKVTAGGAATGRPAAGILVQKIHLRDASVEVPKAPEIFTREFKPEIDVQIGTQSRPVGASVHYVTVKATVTATLGEETAFLVEVEYAGVFDLPGIDDQATVRAVLGARAPAILFPYLREAVSEMIQRAGFPPLLLQPVDFDALYREHLTREASGGAH